MYLAISSLLFSSQSKYSLYATVHKHCELLDTHLHDNLTGLLFIFDLLTVQQAPGRPRSSHFPLSIIS